MFIKKKEPDVLELAKKYGDQYKLFGTDAIIIFVFTVISFVLPFVREFNQQYEPIIRYLEIVSFVILVLALVFFFFQKIRYARMWNTIVNEYTNADCKEIVGLLATSNKRETFDVFLYAIWAYINNNKYLKEMFQSKEYEENSALTNSDYTMLSILSCFSYQSDNGKFYRTPALIDRIKIREEILNDYYKEINRKNRSKDKVPTIIRKLQEIENKVDYSDLRDDDKKNNRTLQSRGRFKDVFSSFSNNEGDINLFKKLSIIPLFILIICDYIDLKYISENTITAIFEIITVFLLCIDIFKNKDNDILH